jgi:hypothetical protein
MSKRKNGSSNTTPFLGEEKIEDSVTEHRYEVFENISEAFWKEFCSFFHDWAKGRPEEREDSPLFYGVIMCELLRMYCGIALQFQKSPTKIKQIASKIMHQHIREINENENDSKNL